MLNKTRRALDKNFPELKDARFVETWAGMIEASPDMIPIMGNDETLEGFYLATGFSGHGFGFGPGAGEAMADLITGNRSANSLKDFRLNRFFDGSKIELGPTVLITIRYLQQLLATILTSKNSLKDFRRILQTFLQVLLIHQFALLHPTG